MTLTQQRIEQIGVILSRPERPSTIKQIAEHIGIHKTHISRLLQKDMDNYKRYIDNKRYHQQERLRSSMKQIEDFMQERDCDASYASLALGFNPSYYAKLKGKLING